MSEYMRRHFATGSIKEDPLNPVRWSGTQQNAPASQGQYSNSCAQANQWQFDSAAINSIKGQREMSAADLGLRCNCDRIDCAQCHQTWLRSFVSPYAFWLGADA